LIINPGTGPATGGTLANAEANIAQLVTDIIDRLPRGITDRSLSAIRNPGGDRAEKGMFSFTLRIYVKGTDGTPYEAIHSVEMPGLPLTAVRFGAHEDDSSWDFHRLYLDENSWLWKYALSLIVGSINKGLGSRID
jgi:hypothetical protein